LAPAEVDAFHAAERANWMRVVRQELARADLLQRNSGDKT
jgi:hypothetical protein